jgi:pimeloyl-ACP methyl ester carboxylesterase
MRIFASACYSIFQVSYLCLCLVGVVASILLIAVASNAQGQQAGLLFLSLAGTGIAVWPAQRPRLAGALFLVSLSLLLLRVSTTPLQSPDSRLVVVYRNIERAYRLSPSTLVPEADQLLLGAKVAAVLDPLLTFSRGNRLSGLTKQIYRELAADDDFALAPSALGTCYQEVLGRGATRGPLLVYRPSVSQATALPVLLFVHGSLGNFRAYSWILKALADQRKLAIVAPSFGAGNWYKPGGLETLQDALDYIQEQPDLDPSKVTLVALSNGGIGAGMLAQHAATRLQSIVLISAVLWSQHFGTPDFPAIWGTKPLLLLHGQEDERVSIDNLKKYSQAFEAANLAVSRIWYPEEDHFLFFSKRKELLADIDRWGCTLKQWECVRGEVPS